MFPLPEANVARPEFVGYRFRCASSTSGFSQPTIIRLRISTRLRIRVSGNTTTIPVDRMTIGWTSVETLPVNVTEDIRLYCFTVFFVNNSTILYEKLFGLSIV